MSHFSWNLCSENLPNLVSAWLLALSTEGLRKSGQSIFQRCSKQYQRDQQFLNPHALGLMSLLTEIKAPSPSFKRGAALTRTAL